jgi:hypothetical protein
VTKGILTAALATGDLVAAAAALDQDVVFHSPVLATAGDEIRGHVVVGRILQTAFACCGMPRNVEESRRTVHCHIRRQRSGQSDADRHPRNREFSQKGREHPRACAAVACREGVPRMHGT